MTPHTCRRQVQQFFFRVPVQAFAMRAFVIVVLLLVATVYADTDSNSLQDDESKNSTSSPSKYRLPEELYRKAFSFMVHSKVFKNFTFQQAVDLVDSLDTWEASDEIQRNFPYYLSGYDFDDRPVWIAEAGKYNVRKWVERGGDDLQNLLKYMFQASIRILKSFAAKDRPGREVREGVFFGDMDGFDMTQVTHFPTVAFVLNEALTWREFIDLAMGRLIVVNANYPTQLAASIARPIAGKLMERVELFGTNRAKWMAEIRRLLPEESIPTWYGGKSTFKPLEIYG
ncbi:unnamed protein product [Allacma fusca]|uniref:CRAL-TRIO domain-containing protein n=1 Tax=Allacma fusca TaxID=39272 RepID=A0A8J2PN92_9HEXA|nr:unnamed protein product [Allacma fusca]